MLKFGFYISVGSPLKQLWHLTSGNVEALKADPPGLYEVRQILKLGKGTGAMLFLLNFILTDILVVIAASTPKVDARLGGVVIIHQDISRTSWSSRGVAHRARVAIDAKLGSGELVGVEDSGICCSYQVLLSDILKNSAAIECPLTCCGCTEATGATGFDTIIGVNPPVL